MDSSQAAFLELLCSQHMAELEGFKDQVEDAVLACADPGAMKENGKMEMGPAEVSLMRVSEVLQKMMSGNEETEDI